MKDYVILVDKKNKSLGIMDKLKAHSDKTPLHRAFSLFLFNSKKELLIQQRSFSKKTWPGVWTNSVCGHPKLYERPIAAARRRLAFELRITNTKIEMALPDYRYLAEKDGIVENEICPVMIGFSDDMPRFNKDEVAAIKWIAWTDWISEIKNNAAHYSPWCVEETKLLIKNKKV
jgi:isopentenyl-diphosphate delta-isomerase